MAMFGKEAILDPHFYLSLCPAISLYYEVCDEGEPLILISGLGRNRTFWEQSVAVLKKRYRVIIYDTRGISKTGAPAGPYSMEQFADDLAGLMDELGLKKANILGFSMSGNIAQAFALRYPERISKLIIATSFAMMNKQTRLFIDDVLSVYEGGATASNKKSLLKPFSVNFRQTLTRTALQPISPTIFGHYTILKEKKR